MANKSLILATLFISLISIEKTEAWCPNEITADEFDSLQKGNEIATDDGAHYVKNSLLPKTAQVKHGETLTRIYQGSEPSYCGYTGGQVTSLMLKKK